MRSLPLLSLLLFFLSRPTLGHGSAALQPQTQPCQDVTTEISRLQGIVDSLKRIITEMGGALPPEEMRRLQKQLEDANAGIREQEAEAGAPGKRNFYNHDGGKMILSPKGERTVFEEYALDQLELKKQSIYHMVASYPTKIHSLSQSGIVSLRASQDHSFALKKDGEVLAFGTNRYFQLGLPTNTTQWFPEPIDSLAGASDLSSGARHTLLVLKGKLHSCGLNSDGQLGEGKGNATVQLPQEVPVGTDVVSVAAGGWHSLALGSDGMVYAFGFNRDGQMGQGAGTSGPLTQMVPQMVPGLSQIKQIAASVLITFGASDRLGVLAVKGEHNLALNADGQVFGWGANTYGQLGLGNSVDQLVATRLKFPTADQVARVAVGSVSSLVLTSQGNVYSSGFNDFGNLGLGDENSRNRFVQSKELSEIDGLECGALHSIAITQGSGRLMVFGNNAFGQLGLNSTIDYSIPQMNPFIEGVQSVAAGAMHTLVLKANGDVYAFGRNSEGQLGVGADLAREMNMPEHFSAINLI